MPMRYIAAFIFIVHIAGCTTNQPTFLEGEWRSNKELTVENYTENHELTPKKKEFLSKELGKLTLVFKGSKTAQYYKGENEKSEWRSFRIIENNGNKFTIEFDVPFPYPDVKSSYIMESECFHQEQLFLGIREYFCKL